MRKQQEEVEGLDVDQFSHLPWSQNPISGALKTQQKVLLN